jgi:choloylglycine hydrolase
MRKPSAVRSVTRLLIAALLASAVAQPSAACTRAVYLGPSQTVVVARSMDWVEDPGSNLWVFPRGMKRNGAAGPNSINWTSKYGSVVTSFYEVSSVDGINEPGLVANVLYLVESDYGKPAGAQPTLSIAAWAQYVLDNFATVAEAVDALRKEPFAIIAPSCPMAGRAWGTFLFPTRAATRRSSNMSMASSSSTTGASIRS